MQLNESSVSKIIAQTKNDEIQVSLKDIFFDNNYIDILKEHLNPVHGEVIEVINSNTLLLKSNKESSLTLVDCSHKGGDLGVAFRFYNAHGNEEVLKYLLEQYQITNYTISDKVGGRSPKYGEMTLVTANPSRFIHDQAEFNKIGYLIN